MKKGQGNTVPWPFVVVRSLAGGVIGHVGNVGVSEVDEGTVAA